MNKKKLAILSTGNVSHHDQGIAIYAGKYLESNYSFDPCIDIIKDDVKGMSLIDTFMQYEEIIVLDAIGVDDTPGSIYHFPMREFRNLSTDESVDDKSVLGCLNFLESKKEVLPNVSLLAIVPDNIEEGIGLSPILKHSLEAYILNIVKTVEKQGFSYEEKAEKDTLDSVIESFSNQC